MSSWRIEAAATRRGCFRRRRILPRGFGQVSLPVVARGSAQARPSGGRSGRGQILHALADSNVPAPTDGALRRHGLGRGASDPRSHWRCRPQARRFNPAGFSFGFGRFGKLLLLLRLAWGRRWWSRPTKSGGPPLFEPSLKVQGYNAHNRNSGFAAPLQCDDLNAHRVRKVPRRIAPICWRR